MYLPTRVRVLNVDALFGFTLVGQDKKEGEIKSQQVSKHQHQRLREDMLASCKHIPCQ